MTLRVDDHTIVVSELPIVSEELGELLAVDASSSSEQPDASRIPCAKGKSRNSKDNCITADITWTTAKTSMEWRGDRERYVSVKKSAQDLWLQRNMT